MTDDDGRPSPEDLLPIAMEEERRHEEGRLTIYLGYTAGVGKTYTMLADALSLRSEGTTSSSATSRPTGDPRPTPSPPGSSLSRP